MRIGQGWDSHAFKPGVPLKIGGVAIEHPEGLAGHSDGDVLLHAITDALLGAVAAGDIGTFFPPNDPRWKDADSAIFLNLAIEEIQNAGYRIVNVDTTLVLAAPKISPIAFEIRERIADMLDLELHAVSVKAKTPEGMDLDHVAQAHAMVLLQKVEEPGDLKALEAVIEDPLQLEDVVKDLVGQVHGSHGDSGVAVSVPERRRIKLPKFDTEDIT
jgi:2-C-methyl-D-erythritol 2,4-cyclodiphosphate synthase